MKPDLGYLAKRMKYAFKLAVLSRSPATYWGARRMLRGLPEPEMALLPDFCRGAGVALDIGANFGMYTYALSRLVKTVHAFEPIPRLVAALAKGAGKLPGVTVHALALSSEDGETELRVPRANYGYSTIEAKNELDGKVAAHIPIDRVPVKLRRLDGLALDGVGFIKIDVEGHELAVVAGGIDTIRRGRPTLLIEAEDRHRPGTRRGLVELLAPLDYGVFVLERGALVPLSIDQDRPEHRNLIFIPRERA